MRTNKTLVSAIAFAVLALSSFGAWATFTPPTADFCTLFGNLITNPVVGYLPPDFAELVPLFKPPLADINGESMIDINPSTHPQDYPRSQYPQAYTEDPPGSGNWVLLPTVIDIHGNGMRDCGAELGVVYKCLTGMRVDCTATGGVSSQMVINAWSHNWDTLGTCIGTYWTLIGSPAPELRFILVAYLTIGDGSFEIDAGNPNIYHFSGGGGLVEVLLTILNNNHVLGQPSMMDLSNYTLLPQFLASASNVSGRYPSCTNMQLYQMIDKVRLPVPIPDPLPSNLLTEITTGDLAYVDAALDPSQGCLGCKSAKCLCGEPELLLDSDHDGLPDCMEIAYGTDPRNPDTDGGGIFDGVEVSLGMDPLDPSDDHLVPVTNGFELALLGAVICLAARRRLRACEEMQ